MCKLSLNNSTVFELTLSNPLASPSYVNTASVSVVLLDKDGQEVTGQSWPLILPFVAGSEGVYRETVPPISGLVAKEIYTARYSAIGADGLIGTFLVRQKAEE